MAGVISPSMASARAMPKGTDDHVCLSAGHDHGVFPGGRLARPGPQHAFRRARVRADRKDLRTGKGALHPGDQALAELSSLSVNYQYGHVVHLYPS